MTTLPLRPMGFGEIVDGAVQLFRRDFGLYYLIALAATVPSYAIRQVAQLDQAPFGPDGFDPLAAVSQLLPVAAVAIAAVAIGSIGTIAVCAAIADRTAGNPASVARSYGTALRRLPSVWGAWILAFLGFVPIAFLWVMVSGFLITGLAQAGPVLGVLAVIAAILMAVLLGAGYLGATFGIVPAAVMEGCGPVRALTRSVGLCRSGWLRVVGIMLVALIISWIPDLGLVALLGFEEFFASPDTVEQVSSRSQWISGMVAMAVHPLTIPFTVGCMVVLFHDRRVRSEGYDLEARARTLADA